MVKINPSASDSVFGTEDKTDPSASDFVLGTSLAKGGWGKVPLSKGERFAKQIKGDLYSGEFLKSRNLVFNGRHLPYNPELKEKAKGLRKEMTKAERKLWYDFLRNIRPRFLRQRPIDNFIVDFYCPELALVIEVDGEVHYLDGAQEKDAERTAILEGYGLEVLRFQNEEVLKHFDDVSRHIEERIDPSASDSVLGTSLVKGGYGKVPLGKGESDEVAGGFV